MPGGRSRRAGGSKADDVGDKDWRISSSSNKRSAEQVVESTNTPPANVYACDVDGCGRHKSDRCPQCKGTYCSEHFIETSLTCNYCVAECRGNSSKSQSNSSLRDELDRFVQDDISFENRTHGEIQSPALSRERGATRRTKSNSHHDISRAAGASISRHGHYHTLTRPFLQLLQ